MKKQINCCPFCGDSFDQNASDPDSRYPSGYECESCDETFEIKVNQFPVA